MATEAFEGTPCVSPLTGETARLAACGLPGGPWRMVREADGLRYVVGARLSPRCEAERRQLLLVARYFARMGAIAVFFRDRDRRAFGIDRLGLLLGSAEPWFVRD